MENNKFKIWLIWGFAVIPVLTTLVAYPFLPDRIPLHWNALGEVDRTGDKFPGAFIPPVICLLIPVLMNVMPKIDPRRENYEKFRGTYYWLRICILVVLNVVNGVVMLISLGIDFIRVDYIIKFFVSILIIAIGNLMPKIKHNYFVGIKTPWTIAKEEVWFSTHRHAGVVWFAAGLVMVVLAFIPGLASALVYLGVILAAAIEPMVYSYIKYKKHRFESSVD